MFSKQTLGISFLDYYSPEVLCHRQGIPFASLTVSPLWPCLLRQEFVLRYMVLAQGWCTLGISQVVGILSTIRNRILGFALELEASYPDAGAANSGRPSPSADEVSKVFQQNITQNFHGPVANVASGHGIEQAGTINIEEGDFRTLATYLQENGVPKEDVRELAAAIQADPQPKRNSKAFGKNVAGWVGKMIAKSAEGAWKVGTDVASKFLVEAIKAHYGMHP